MFETMKYTGDTEPSYCGGYHGHYVAHYPNGYGVSIVTCTCLGGHSVRCGLYRDAERPYEVAILKRRHIKGSPWKITYTTPITGDVLGWQTQQDVANIIEQVKSL